MEMPPLVPLCLLGTLPRRAALCLPLSESRAPRGRRAKASRALCPAWLGPRSGVTSGGAPGGL